jgi:hypothetical protein
MKTQMSQRKASKGTVQIKNSNERLQLVFSYTGKRHYLSTGFTDTPANRKLAEMKARQIELDILCGNFDTTLAKYKPELLLSTVTPTLNPTFTPVVEADQLCCCVYRLPRKCRKLRLGLRFALQ